jgi:eukaryotic-like serine/threonine-protein kinase
VVLHELLTGKRLFDGETVSHTLADVLRSEIDFSPIPAGPVRELIGRCLDRNLKTRLRDIGEARIAIDRYLGNPVVEAPVASRSRWPWAVAALGGWGAFLRKPAQMAGLSKWEVGPPEGSEFASITSSGGSAISPDGRMLAIIAKDANGVNSLYLRPLDSPGGRFGPRTARVWRLSRKES